MNGDVQRLEAEVIALRERVAELEAYDLQRQQAEQILRTIVEGTAAATSGDFLQLLVRKLAAAMNVRYAFITECTDAKPVKHPTQLRTLAFWKGEDFGENFEYGITGTPCEYVTQDKTCCYYPTNIQALFPRDQDLVALNAESYIGIPLLDSRGDVMGHLAALDDKPMVDREFLVSIMKIFTARAAAEMERKQSEEALRQSAAQLSHTLQDLQRTQMQLVQSEKMSALGQLVAGIAHEINNPVNFIYANLGPARKYIQDLLDLHALYAVHFPQVPPEIASQIASIDLDFLQEDAPKLLASIQSGAERIQGIVQSLRLFSHLDEADLKFVDIHQGIESTLMLLESRIQAKNDLHGVVIRKAYGDLPPIECYARQLNQVFMNILLNSIDALATKRLQANPQELPTIEIRSTRLDGNRVSIQIIDNGCGMDEATQAQIFNPFFTTKPVGQGTGLGLSIAYQIITEQHRGILCCRSAVGQGTELRIEVPISLTQGVAGD